MTNNHFQIKTPSTNFFKEEINSKINDLSKIISDFELNLKLNYNMMLINIFKFKPQLAFSMNHIKETEGKILFLLTTNSEENIQIQLHALERRLHRNKDYLIQLLTMYELQTKSTVKKLNFKKNFY